MKKGEGRRRRSQLGKLEVEETGVREAAGRRGASGIEGEQVDSDQRGAHGCAD